ncbi:MAG: glycine zipper domain-containing protein [Planctomycetota bacterium]
MFFNPKHRPNAAKLAAIALPTALLLTGCQSLPGDARSQGTVLGTLGGAVAGAAIGDSAGGALVGGVIGAGSGYLIGNGIEESRARDARRLQSQTVTHAAPHSNPHAGHALNAHPAPLPTADLNGDGFVTDDELVALSRAGLTDGEILDRLQRTGQQFSLTPAQRQGLRTRGVSAGVLDRLGTLNRGTPHASMASTLSHSPR